MHTVYLSLGSNLGDRKATMRRAIGFESTNKFLNMCVRLLTTLSPEQLLLATKQIERELGRTQKSVNGQYHDRPIDIDILMYDDVHLDSDDLTLPHPHMQEREFVMKPLREILSIGS